ncbi:WS/DGAT/MGAT family acyltransferase [Chitinivorax tropicus]|uniref:diacylglycerol O-acyltransferase n=1 Tax=Chitinivorax tropicus TaxID=714531 RepID=A0A840MT23_9PROT|nr:wax ester/triacylglycerol synthase family O-acyltransferase [Chitinivorax tropicus]MBB5019423.1 WS/DGAT/MGAT family acyltransferase [Chitinivorax tropicus]
MIWNLNGPEKRSMSAVDTAWLRMDRRTNLMMIVGILIFESPLPIDEFKQLLETRFLKYRRFRQCPVGSGTSYYWEDALDFHLDNHVSRVSLTDRATHADLQDFVSELASSKLDDRHPLWHFHLVEDFEGGTALVARIHHCYADGIALIQVLLGMTDGAVATRRKRKAQDDEQDGDLWNRLYRPFAGAVTGAVKFYWDVIEGTIDLVKSPSKLMKYTSLGLGITSDAAKVLSMSNDPHTSLKGELTDRKRCVWAEPLDLNEVKLIGKALDCTINDVLLASVAGALRNYLLSRGDVVDGQDIRAFVPVNMRPTNKMDRLGNYFGLVALSLPIGIANPFARLYELKRRMEELKHSHEAVVALGLLGVAGALPNVVQQFSFDLLTKKASAVMTNVPGPKEPIFMIGSQLKDIMFWVPSSGEIGMGVSILSYNGQIRFGVIADSHLVPDPENIVNRLQSEFDKLLYGTLLNSWEQPLSPVVIEQEIHDWITVQELESVLEAVSQGK